MTANDGERVRVPSTVFPGLMGSVYSATASRSERRRVRNVLIRRQLRAAQTAAATPRKAPSDYSR